MTATSTHTHSFYSGVCEDCEYVCQHEDQEYCGEGIYCPTCEQVIVTNDELREDEMLRRAEMDAEDYGR